MAASKQKRPKKSPKKSSQKSAKSILYDRAKKSAESVGAEFMTDRPEVEKMSDVILNYAKPLTEVLPEDDDESFQKAVIAAMMIWNAAILPDSEGKPLIKQMADEIGKSDLEARKSFLEMAEFMLERKRKRFRNNKRFIIDYEIKITKKDRELSVVSTLDSAAMKKIPEFRGQVRRWSIRKVIYAFILILIIVGLYFIFRR